MRGSPLIPLLFVTACLSLAGLGVFVLTTPRSGQEVTTLDLELSPSTGDPAVETPELPAEKEGILTLAFSSPLAPSRIEVRRDGELLWEQDEPGPSARKEISVLYPREGLQLEITAKWQGLLPGDRAIRFAAAFDNAALDSEIFWQEGDISAEWSLPPLGSGE